MMGVPASVSAEAVGSLLKNYSKISGLATS